MFQVGELEVLVEDSPRAALAAVVRGHPPPELRVALEQALEAIEARFGTALDSFGGDTAPFDGAKDALETVPAARATRSSARAAVGAVRLVWLAAAVAVAVAIGGSGAGAPKRGDGRARSRRSTTLPAWW